MKLAAKWLSMSLTLALASPVLAQDPPTPEPPAPPPEDAPPVEGGDAPKADGPKADTAAAAPTATQANDGDASQADAAAAVPTQVEVSADTELASNGQPDASDEDVSDEPVDVREALQLHVGDMRIAPVMLVSAYGTPYAGTDSLFQSGDIAEQGGFRLRHARFGLDTAYKDQAQLRVSTELAHHEGGEARIHDAYLGYTPFEWAQLFAGAQRVPISRFQHIRSGRGALMERPLATRSMAPGQQVGLTGSGSLWEGALSWSLGVFNGLRRGNLFYEGWDANYAPFGNRFDGLAYAVRIGSEPLERLPNTAADEGKGDLRLGVGANYMYSDGGARDVHLGGGDVHLMWAGLHVIGEAIWMRSLPESEPTQAGAAPFEVTSVGMVGEAGYMILERMLGVTGRFEWIDANTQSDDETDNWLVTGGAHLHVVDQLLKVQAEYTHREERFGLSLDNDSVTISLQGQLDPARPRGEK